MTDHPVPASQTAPALRSWTRRLLRPVLRVWLRLDVEGADRLPSSGPVLIASTHCSHADSPALACALDRPVHFLGDERLTRWPLLGPLLPRLGMVPVRRGTGDAEALDRLEELLGDGHVVAVYPEGSRSRDGRVHRPRSGLSRLAARLQVPVLPVGVAGTHAVWPTGRGPRLVGGPVTVRVGHLLGPPDDTPLSRRAWNDRLQEVLAELAGTESAPGFSPVGGEKEAA